MADFERDEHEGGGGFMMGLLTGTVLGAGLGMLLAPKSGSELRSQIGGQARRAAGAAGHMAERARDAVRGSGDDLRARSHERTAALASGGSHGEHVSPAYGGATAGPTGSTSTPTTRTGVTGESSSGTSTYTGTPGSNWAPLTERSQGD